MIIEVLRKEQQVPKGSSEGTCYLCNSTLSKGGMTRHLQSCLQREVVSEAPPGRKTKLLHLAIEGRYLPDYWMHLEAPADGTLDDLDDFLRDIWLECCGHLSAFTIGERTYFSHPGEDLGDEGMDVALGGVLRPGTRLQHEYDFGTSTYLTLRVLSEREAETSSKSIEILARNNPPLITCEMCAGIASLVCAACIWSGRGWVCEECAGEHECGEEMLLPVVNSPRVGMCAYTGRRR